MSIAVCLLLKVVHFSREGSSRFLLGEHQLGSLLSEASSGMCGLLLNSLFLVFYLILVPCYVWLPQIWFFSSWNYPILCECGDLGTKTPLKACRHFPFSFVTSFQSSAVHGCWLPPCPKPFGGPLGVIHFAHMTGSLYRHYDLTFPPLCWVIYHSFTCFLSSCIIA